MRGELLAFFKKKKTFPPAANFPKNWNSSSSSAVSALIPTFLIEFIFYSFLWQSISLTCAANLALLTNRSNTHMHTYTHVHTHVHTPICFACLSPHIPHFVLPYTSSSPVSPLMLLYLAKFLSLTGCCWKRRSHMWRGQNGVAGGGVSSPPPYISPLRPLETPPDWETSAPTARASCTQKHGDLHLLSRPGDYTVAFFFSSFILTPASFTAQHFLAIPSIISGSWNTGAYLQFFNLRT